MSGSLTLDSDLVLPRGGFKAWMVCLSAGLFFFYEFFQLNIFDVINQSLRADFALNAAQLSWMSSMYLWADILFLLPAGVILDRYSTRKVVLSAMIICVGSTIGFSLTHSFLFASFYHFLAGIGNAFCFLACVVLVSRWFPPKRQAFVIGMLVTMAFLGGMVAHTPFAGLVEYYGWRHALLIDGMAGCLLIFWIYLTLDDAPRAGNARIEANKVGLPGFYQALSNRQTWLAGLYTTLLNLPIMVLCALWGASYLKLTHHLAEMAASNVISMIFMGSIIGCPLAGWLSDNQGRRKPLMLAGALMSFLSLLPLFLGFELSVKELGMLFFALGFFTSTQVISYPLIAESNPAENTGTATGLASVLIMGGGGIGQILFGWLVQHHAVAAISQGYTTADFEFAMWMFPITIAIALFAVLILRETYCQRSAAKTVKI